MNIPRRTEHFLAHGATPGTRHSEYLAAVCQLRDAGLMQSETERLILDRAQLDNLPTSEAQTIVRDIYSAPARQPLRRGGTTMRYQFGNGQQSRPVRKPKPLPPSSPIPSPIPNGATLLIKQLYLQGELARIVPSAVDPSDSKAKPSSKGYIFPMEFWLQKLEAAQQDPNKLIRPEGGTGVYIAINPLRDKDNVGESGISSFRHILLEWDNIQDLGQQWAIIQAMKLPAVAVIHSGGKSLHVILKVNAESKQEYDAIAARLYDYCAQWHVDPANRNASRLTRLPGCERSGQRQDLIFIDPNQTQTVQDYLDEYDDGLPPIVGAATLLNDTTCVTPPLLIDRILHKGCRMVIGSNSKAHKSWLLLLLAVCLATGREFLGHPCRKSRAILINFEILPAFMRERLDAVCRHLNIAPDELTNLEIWNMRGQGAQFGYILDAMIRRLSKNNYDAILIDPIYKALAGKDENSAGDVGLICADLERIGMDTGASVIFSAHYAKGNAASKEAMDRISGSGVFARDPDVIMTLTANEASEKHWTTELSLRNLPEHPPFVVTWKFPLMVVETNPLIKPDQLKQPKKPGRPSKYDIDVIIDILAREKALSAEEWRELCIAETGMSKTTFFSLSKEAQIKGRVVKQHSREEGIVKEYLTVPD